MALTKATAKQITFKLANTGAVVRSLFDRLSDFWTVKDLGYARDQLYILSDTTLLKPTSDNLLTNGSFYVWPMGDSTSFAVNEDKYFAANWRLKMMSATTATASKLNTHNGGLSLAMTFGATAEYVYLRQLAPIITQMSKGVVTLSADVEVDVEVEADLYIQARKTANDVDRSLVTDTPNLVLAPGRHRIVATVAVPDVSSWLSTVDAKNSLEFSLRFYGANKTVNAKVYEVILNPGETPYGPLIVHPGRVHVDAEAYYEKGGAQITGFSTTSGQKRLTAPYRTRKITQPAVTITDLVGNVDKVSTYDAAGARTDNVAITAKSITQDYVIVIINGSTAAGMSFNYTANSLP